jgi:cellulose synthase/poly-beta-1,6-N-acetylglucosamine synthase-like glycosyltransferase
MNSKKQFLIGNTILFVIIALIYYSIINNLRSRRYDEKSVRKKKGTPGGKISEDTYRIYLIYYNLIFIPMFLFIIYAYIYVIFLENFYENHTL